MASKAVAFKEEGNKCFQAGDYKGAEALYTSAILKDPTNPNIFTNRAFSRIKLQSWDGCINDCLKAIDLLPSNMKAYYYLARAQLALHHPNEATNSALTAYDLCISTNSPSTRNVSELVLKAKKEKWDVRERDRLRTRNAMLRELEERLDVSKTEDLSEIDESVKFGDISPTEAEEQRIATEDVARRKIEELQSLFALADPQYSQKREVPDYLIDDISFSVMHDPVVTKTGRSYDRTTILEHLKRSETDPLTRDPLRKEDLRPNLALKQACDEFWEKNGWAVDY